MHLAYAGKRCSLCIDIIILSSSFHLSCPWLCNIADLPFLQLPSLPLAGTLEPRQGPLPGRARPTSTPGAFTPRVPSHSGRRKATASATAATADISGTSSSAGELDWTAFCRTTKELKKSTPLLFMTGASRQYQQQPDAMQNL